MSGLEYLMRHIGLLPDEERDALRALIQGRPYDAFHAKNGARRLWGRCVVRDCGFEEVL